MVGNMGKTEPCNYLGFACIGYHLLTFLCNAPTPFALSWASHQCLCQDRAKEGSIIFMSSHDFPNKSWCFHCFSLSLHGVPRCFLFFKILLRIVPLSCSSKSMSVTSSLELDSTSSRFISSSLSPAAFLSPDGIRFQSEEHINSSVRRIHVINQTQLLL